MLQDYSSFKFKLKLDTDLVIDSPIISLNYINDGNLYIYKKSTIATLFSADLLLL